MFGGINFGDLVKNSPICQIKIPAKVSGYTVCQLAQLMIVVPSVCTAGQVSQDAPRSHKLCLLL